MGIAGVWVQQLAADLNDSITYSNAGGTNYAEAGAVTGEGNDGINMHNQVAAYLAGTNGKPAGKASPTALYALFGGSNDITNNLTSSTLNKVAATAADNIATEINSLANAGGQNFLWLNMCSLETTPRYYGTSSQSTLASADAAFDNEWTKDLARLKTAHPNMILIGYDYHSLCVNAVVDPASYGFTDALDAWTTAPASVMYSKHSSDPDADYFVSWDGIHPTTRFQPDHRGRLPQRLDRHLHSVAAHGPCRHAGERQRDAHVEQIHRRHQLHRQPRHRQRFPGGNRERHRRNELHGHHRE